MTQYKPHIMQFLDIYQKLDATSLHLLHSIYTSDVVFIDPAHEVHGLDALKSYFKKLYQGALDVSFDYKQVLTQGDDAVIIWEMAFAHPRLAGGKSIAVQGSTHLSFNASDKVYYHRDYFDLGQMLYEHIPVVGRGVKLIKDRLGS